MTLALARMVSQIRWKTDGNSGFARPRYWNSSSTITKRLPLLRALGGGAGDGGEHRLPTGQQGVAQEIVMQVIGNQ